MKTENLTIEFHKNVQYNEKDETTGGQIMKRSIILCLLLLSVLGGCTKKTEVSPVESTMAGIPNPVKEVDGPEALEPLGGSMVLPEDASDVRYSIIADTIAQVQFRWEGAAFTYRGARTEEDIIGVYEEREDEVIRDVVEAEGATAEVTIQTTVTGGRIALWRWGDVQYSLYTGDEIDGPHFLALAEALAAGSLNNE